MKKYKNFWVYALLWVLWILGALSVTPYLLATGLLPESASMNSSKIVILFVVEVAISFAVLLFLSSLLLKRIDISPLDRKITIRETLIPGALVGVVLGIALYAYTLRYPSLALLDTGSTVWIGIIASFYGGINEELLMRLFLFSLIYFLFSKYIKYFRQRRTLCLWSVNILVALLFGIAHISSRMTLLTFSFSEIFGILFLNMLASAVFGYLYWTQGLWVSMFAHFITDVVYRTLLVSSH